MSGAASEGAVNVEALRALLAKATPGPWAYERIDRPMREVRLKRVHYQLGSLTTKRGIAIVFGATGDAENDDDARLIAGVVNAAPALLATAAADAEREAQLVKLRDFATYLAAKVVFVHDDRLAMDDDTANAARAYLKEPA